MLQILPSWYPVVALAAIVGFVKYGQRLVEVLAIDVVEDLPEYLAVFELVPCAHTARQIKGVDL